MDHDPQTPLHRQRDRAESFGGQAAAYAEHRPGYPPDAVRWALEPVAHRTAATTAPHVLDLAAGTGKLTEVLMGLGFRVTAVEPDPEMLAELRRRLPETPARAGSAEEIPLPDASVDAVLVGQAFHWFDPDLALPEIARVLRPGGALAGLWNTDDDQVEWVAGLGEISGAHVSVRNWRRQEHRVPAHEAFGPVRRSEFPHSQTRTVESLTATVATHSNVRVLPEEERARLLGRVGGYLRSRQETGGGGEFELPLVTMVERTVRGA